MKKESCMLSFFLRIICAKITFARSNNNYKLSFIHYFPNFKFLGRVYEKKMLLFLCVYLVALVLMGITIQLYIKFYLSAVDMNIPKISKNTKRLGMIERFSYKKENLLKMNLFMYLKYFVQSQLRCLRHARCLLQAQDGL